MMNNDPQRPVSLEELLRLKRAERPPVEFWAQFDRELRAKQLTALVEKRSWWRIAVPQLFTGLARYHLPIGATAVLTFTFLVVRNYHPVMVPPTGAVTSSSAAVSTASLVGAESRTVVSAAVALTAMDDDDSVLVSASAQGEFPVSDGAETASRYGSAALVATARGEVAEEMISPTARTIKANLVAAHQAHPELARKFLGQARGYEARVASRAQVVEPLSQMSLPSDVRRSRLLASALPVSTAAPARTSDRVPSRLSEDRLYDSVSRYGVGGNTLSIKF